MLKSILIIALTKYAVYNDPVYVKAIFNKMLSERSPYMYLASEMNFSPVLTEDENYILKAALDITTDISVGDSIIREIINNYKH